MPQYHIGNMWSAYDAADLFCITTNSFVNRAGALVMGRGIAAQARDRFPGLDKRLGREILSRCGLLGAYYMIFDPATKIAAFQVKYHFAETADLELIYRSIGKLLANSPRFHAIHLNFPGIGNGHLARGSVLPMLEVLPDNIHIWEMRKE